MLLTEEEEKQAAKNRQFMRHMTLSFWGFIIIAILSLFVWAKVQRFLVNEEPLTASSSDIKDHVQLFIHPEDDTFWLLSKTEMEEVLKSWKDRNVQRVWVPISVQSIPFFKSKALKYSLSAEIPAAVEFDWYQKAVFPMLNELLTDAEIKIGGYFWYAPTRKSTASFLAYSSQNWEQPNSGFLNSESDSVVTYIKALADESIVSWNVDAFAMVTESLSNTATLNAEILLLSKALERHQIASTIQTLQTDGNGFDKTYMSINKWVSLTKAQKSEMYNFSEPFLIMGSDTTSVVLY